MKLVIQIPCYNESATLPETVRDLPREVEGFDSIEVLVIDDGSSDGTAEVARGLGVQHIVRFPRNRGLAQAFSVGLQTALSLGADVIVNTDGDHQYSGACISDLVKPIVSGEAELVVGDRRVDSIPHFSRSKKLLQKVGSWVVRWASGTSVPDATSGFRAFSREAALQLAVYSSYTYTLETIIQAGKRGIPVASVPVQTNEKRRESRLIRSVPRYVVQSAVTILRIFVMYEALRVFMTLGSLSVLGGAVLFLRFLVFYLRGEGQGHVQSLILGAVLLILGFQTFLLGVLADLIAKNRQMAEEIRYRLRRIEFRE